MLFPARKHRSKAFVAPCLTAIGTTRLLERFQRDCIRALLVSCSPILLCECSDNACWRDCWGRTGLLFHIYVLYTEASVFSWHHNWEQCTLGPMVSSTNSNTLCFKFTWTDTYGKTFNHYVRFARKHVNQFNDFAGIPTYISVLLMFLNKVLLLQYETAPLLYCLGFLAIGGFIVVCSSVTK